MKKLIAILTIAIVLVGAVFAGANDLSGAATITVTTCVARSLPEFKLAASSSAISTTVPSIADDLTDPADGSLGGTEFDATGTDISVDNLLVYFGIYQTNQANVREEYTLTASATPLYRMNTAGTAKETEEGKAHSIPVATFSNTTEAEVADTVTGHNLIALSAAGHVLTVEYTGKVGTDDTDLLLGTFSVQWNKDVEAPEGTYKADVVLTIATI